MLLLSKRYVFNWYESLKLSTENDFLRAMCSKCQLIVWINTIQPHFSENSIQKLEKNNEKEKRKFNQMFEKTTNKAMIKYYASAENDVRREHCLQPFLSLLNYTKLSFMILK